MENVFTLPVILITQMTTLVLMLEIAIIAILKSGKFLMDTFFMHHLENVWIWMQTTGKSKMNLLDRGHS